MSDDTKLKADARTHDAKIIFERFKRENKEVFDEQNELAKQWFFDPQNIDCIAKAFTMYIFRDGVVENYHGRNKHLDDEAMKEVNIFMVNHIAGLLTYALEGNWLQLRALTAYYSTYNKDWYPAEADTSVIDYMFYDQIRPK